MVAGLIIRIDFAFLFNPDVDIMATSKCFVNARIGDVEEGGRGRSLVYTDGLPDSMAHPVGHVYAPSAPPCR